MHPPLRRQGGKLRFRSVIEFWSRMALMILGGMAGWISWGGEGAVPLDYLHFKRLMPENGMPVSEVTCIYQDSREFLWFGTMDGLARYDGTEIRVFRHTAIDPGSLSDNMVAAITEDAQGNLWIATERGLDCWHRNTERFTHYRHDPEDSTSLSNDGITGVLVNTDGTLWVGTSGGGLNHLDPRQGKAERFVDWSGGKEARRHERIRTMYRDRQGKIWLGTDEGGLIEFDPATRANRVFEYRADDPSSLSHNRVNRIQEDQEGGLWVGTDGGLCRLDSERRRFERFTKDLTDPGALQASIVSAVLVDDDNRIWIGTDGGGLSTYEPETKRFRHFRCQKYSPHTLSSDVVRCIFQDRTGDLWIGLFPAGVNHMNRLTTPIRIYREEPGSTNSLSDNSVLAFWEDPDGDLWVATDRGGLNHWDSARNQWSHYRHDPTDPESLGANAVLCLFRDHQGQLWAGTYQGGLNRFDPERGKFKRYLPDANRPDWLGNPHVWRIAEDTQHRLWIATMGGVDCFLPAEERFIHYRFDPDDPRSLSDNTVWCLLVARDGSLWAGTHGGLSLWNSDTGDWRRFQSSRASSDSLSHNVVVDLYEDRGGRLWIATMGGGLNRLDRVTGRFSSYGVPQGLPSDTAMGVVEDDDGYLWITTNRGLSRLDPRTGEFRNYDESDGLQGLQFNRGSRWKLRSGELMFGGIQGFNRFNPRALGSNPAPPPVVLTGLELFGQWIHPGTEGFPLSKSITELRRLELPARYSVISFRFAALNYRSPEKNQFAFQLENFDRELRQAGQVQRATYTNLDPGKYRFRVLAANNHGVWNRDGTSLELIILPAWWQTWWFRVLAISGFGGGLLMAGWLVSSRKARFRLREAERERKLALERQRSAEALQESQKRYRQLVENANDGIFVVQDGLLKESNNRLVELMGYSVECIIGKPFDQFVHPEDRALVVERHFERAKGASHLPQAYSFRALCRDGRIIWIELNTTVIEWEGRPATLNILRDVTDRKRLEEERFALERRLQETQKLESLGVLAGGVAHDFNNLLTVVLGNAALAAEQVPISSAAGSCLREIEDSARRASELCRQMLAYSGRGSFLQESIQLSCLIQEMAPLLQASVSKKARLDVHLCQPLPLIEGDVSQIRQVVMNLVLNATEALDDQEGVITISTGTSNLSHEELRGYFANDSLKSGAFVWLKVEDSGCGMSPEILERMFEPFFTTKFLGRGLGLSAVLGIVRRHRGTLKTESATGKGTVIQVVFPEAKTEKTGPRSAAMEVAGERWRAGQTVLLADDEESVRRLAAKLLERLGCKVLQASDGQEALEVYRQHAQEIKLVLLDLTMPRMDGVEAFKELNRLNSRLPVIVASGYAQKEIAERFEGGGIAGFIQKPYSMDELRHWLQDILGGFES